MQDIPTVGAAACAALPPPDACNYDSDNAKIMFQSRTHNLEFQLIGEKPENSNIYVVYMQFFFFRFKSQIKKLERWKTLFNLL